jgi:hypothetical protein
MTKREQAAGELQSCSTEDMKGGGKEKRAELVVVVLVVLAMLEVLPEGSGQAHSSAAAEPTSAGGMH